MTTRDDDPFGRPPADPRAPQRTPAERPPIVSPLAAAASGAHRAVDANLPANDLDDPGLSLDDSGSWWKTSGDAQQGSAQGGQQPARGNAWGNDAPGIGGARQPHWDGANAAPAPQRPAAGLGAARQPHWDGANAAMPAQQLPQGNPGFGATGGEHWAGDSDAPLPASAAFNTGEQPASAGGVQPGHATPRNTASAPFGHDRQRPAWDTSGLPDGRASGANAPVGTNSGPHPANAGSGNHTSDMRFVTGSRTGLPTHELEEDPKPPWGMIAGALIGCLAFAAFIIAGNQKEAAGQPSVRVDDEKAYFDLVDFELWIPVARGSVVTTERPPYSTDEDWVGVITNPDEEFAKAIYMRAPPSEDMRQINLTMSGTMGAINYGVFLRDNLRNDDVVETSGVTRLGRFEVEFLCTAIGPHFLMDDGDWCLEQIAFAHRVLSDG